MVPTPRAAERLLERCGSTDRADAELAFLIEAPSAENRLAVASDRGGLVVARTEQVEEAVDVVAAHLSLVEPEANRVRLRARAVVDLNATRAVVLQWPFGFAPPLIERRLQRAGWSMIDRFTVDLEGVGQVLHASFPSVWPSDLSIVGHCGAPTGNLSVDGFVGVGAPPTMGVAVTSIAGAALYGCDREATLDAAAFLADRWHPVSDHKGVYAALDR